MTKVLLAEDNEMNRDMLKRRLERKGFDVGEAVDGEQAIARARDWDPDIILMDLSMPTVDGWEAIKILKDDPDTRHIPIVALTAHAIREEWERAVENGCEAVVTKPFEFTELLETIEKLS